MLQHDIPAFLVGNPIDIAEDMATDNNWPVSRNGEEQVTMQITGEWATYTVFLSTAAFVKTLLINVGIDCKVPKRYTKRMCEATNIINPGIAGDFSHVSRHDYFGYKGTQFLSEGDELSSEIVDALIRYAVATCDQFYPVFQQVARGVPIQEALGIAFEGNYGHA